MTFLTADLRRFCLLLAAAAVLAGCDNAPAPEPEIRWVRTVVTHAEKLDDIFRQVGDIQPHYESDLAFQVPGRIVSRPARLGMAVRKGDVLARLEGLTERNQSTAAEAELAAARAEVTRAVAEERRQSQLRADGWATQARYEDAQRARQIAEAALGVAKAKLDQARDQLGYTLLRAPEDGVVAALGAEAGQVAAAGQMVVRLARLDEKDAVFHLSESLLSGLRPDAEMDVSLLDQPAVSVRGKLREVAPGADPVTRTYEVKVALPKAPAAMRLGMTVVGRMSQEERWVTALPAAALFQQDKVPAVWVVENGTVSLRKVRVFRADLGQVLIDNGLEPGAVVVTAGVQKLRPGQKVRPQQVEGGR